MLRPALLALLVGCARQQAAPAAEVKPLLAPTHYLGEPFALGSATCRLSEAVPLLSEPARPPEGLAAEDVPVVEARFTCEDAYGAPLPFRSLSVQPTWHDQQALAHRPSGRTKLAQQPGHVVFDLAREESGLMPSRRYDAHTGEPLAKYPPGRARLVIQPSSAQSTTVVLAPWPRLHDHALDAFLDQLARNLASATPSDALSDTEQGRTALVLASDLYGQALERAQAQVLSVRAIENVEGQPRLTLSLEPSGGLVSAAPSATLSFELAHGNGGRPSVMRLLDPVAAQSAADCVNMRAELERMLADAAPPQTSPEGALRPDVQCNALGSLLQGPCMASKPALLERALRVGTECADHGALGLDIGEPVALPQDLELKLRRVRPVAERIPRALASFSADRGTRYAVTLARSGRVSFEAPQGASARAPEGALHASARAPEGALHASARAPEGALHASARAPEGALHASARAPEGALRPGPREGRTSPKLLAALWAQLEQMGFSERSVGTGERCENDERGDLITVRANGREYAVRDRAGCRGELSSEELQILARSIERVAALDAWLTPNFPALTSDAEIWVVAAE